MTRTNKGSREGFEIDAELVSKSGKKVFWQPIPLKVNSLDKKNIQKVIDHMNDALTRDGNHRKLVIKGVYRVTKVS